MWRMIASVTCGLVTWAVVVTILNFGLRAAIPDYHAAEATLQFTMAMKLGRLIEAAMSSIAAGAVVAWRDVLDGMSATEYCCTCVLTGSRSAQTR